MVEDGAKDRRVGDVVQDAPAESLYRWLFLGMPAEPSLSSSPTFRRAPAGPQTLVLMRELGRGQIGLDRRRIEVPASGEVTVGRQAFPPQLRWQFALDQPWQAVPVPSIR